MTPGTPKHRVVMVTTVHPLCDVRILYREARSLAAAGYDVEVIGMPPGPEAPIAGVRLTPLRQRRSRVARMLFAGTCLMIPLLRRRAAAYHFHDPELLCVALLLRLLGRRVIYDAHEDLPQQILDKQWIPRPLRVPLSSAARAVLGIASPALNGVVAATEEVAKGFCGRVVVVRNYPDPALFPPMNAASDGPVTFIYVGGISFSRGLREMVDAVAGIPQARLHLVGTVSGEAERLFLGTCDPRHVLVETWMPPAAVYERLAQADVGLALLQRIPRFETALPVKLFEYMAAGLPVIASDFPLWREIVEGAGAGLLVNPQDPQAIAAAINQLAADPELRRAMGERARRAAVGMYNWATEAEKLFGLYGEVLCEKRSYRSDVSAE